MKQAVLIVLPDGTTKHLVDENAERYGAKIGPKVSTQRNSHVETWSSLSEEAKARILTSEGTTIVLKDGRPFCSFSDTDLTNYFWADMLPVADVVLGPYPTYRDALQAEIKYLLRHNLPNARSSI